MWKYKLAFLILGISSFALLVAYNFNHRFHDLMIACFVVWLAEITQSIIVHKKYE